MATLYRQYRPQKFQDISGQEHITQTLGRAIIQDRLAHAYVFHGPRGTGKTTTARVFAKRLNCTDPDGPEPCGKCQHCQAVQSNQSMDIIEIDAASNRSIDDIRALQEGIGLAPGMGKYKIYIVDEVHMLSGPAFTALLKTLEEPVKHAIFVLATTEFHKVPDTILSRCQVFRFRRATHDQMQARLKYLLAQEKREAEDAALELIINRSDGCYRDAESMLGQVLSVYDEGQIQAQHLNDFLGLPPKVVLEKFLGGLVTGESQPSLAALEEAFGQGFDPEQLLHESVLAARDALLALIKEDKQLPFEFASLPGARTKLLGIVRTLLQAVQDLAYVPQPIIAVQIAIATICSKKGEVTSTTPKPTPVPAAKIEIAAPVPAPITEPQAVGEVTVEAIQKIWPQLIEAVRKTNPVGSTFLRAMHPVETSGKTVKLEAAYALHFNFLNKAENKQVLEQALNEILGKQLTVQCALAEPSSRNELAIPKPNAQEDELLSAVKEAFG